MKPWGPLALVTEEERMVLPGLGHPNRPMGAVAWWVDEETKALVMPKARNQTMPKRCRRAWGREAKPWLGLTSLMYETQKENHVL